MSSSPWLRSATIALVVGCAAPITSACDGCRSDARGPAAEGGNDSAAGPPEEQVDGTSPSDSGRRFRDAEPSVDGSRHASAIDPACTGTEIDLAAAVIDPSCAIGSDEAKRLRAALETNGGALPLRQDAARGPGGAIVVRVVNTATRPLALPLSWHAKLPAFTALAENDRHELFEVESPHLDLRSAHPEARAHFARILLMPGGVAVSRPVVVTKVVKRIVPSCADGGGCGPPELPAGKYTLYVGQLVIDVEAGAPAKIEWTIP